MMSLFSTLSLLEVGSAITLFSLLIPILIHLFNPSRGKIVWVGNISLIKTAIHEKITEVKITQILLLLVRLFILLILCLLLMQLVQKQAMELIDDTRVLLHPNWIQSSTDDELLEVLMQHENSRIVLLTADLPEIKSLTVATIRKIAEEYSEHTGTSPLSVQSLLSELDNRPVWLHRNVVYVTNQQLLFNSQIIEVKQDYDWNVKLLNDEQINQLKNNSKIGKIKIDIYFDATRQLDVQYLTQILDYWQKWNKHFFNINLYSLGENAIVSNEGNANGQHHWMFWLADQALPKELRNNLKLGGAIFEDVTLENIEHSHSNTMEARKSESTLVSIDQHDFQFFQLNQNQQLTTGYSPVYNTIDGIPILQIENIGERAHYRFNSRINPQWNDWIIDVGFPNKIVQLLNSNSEKEMKFLDEQQIVSLFEYATQKSYRFASLDSLLVLLLSGLWLLETIMSNLRKRQR